LTLVQVRTQLSISLLQRGLRNHTLSLKCFGPNVQLILPRLLSLHLPRVDEGIRAARGKFRALFVHVKEAWGRP